MHFGASDRESMLPYLKIKLSTQGSGLSSHLGENDDRLIQFSSVYLSCLFPRDWAGQNRWFPRASCKNPVHVLHDFLRCYEVGLQKRPCVLTCEPVRCLQLAARRHDKELAVATRDILPCRDVRDDRWDPSSPRFARDLPPALTLCQRDNAVCLHTIPFAVNGPVAVRMWSEETGKVVPSA
jgi:hypothetical protein